MRHGESVANANSHIIRGQSNYSPLTKTEEKQSQNVGKRLAKSSIRFDIIVSSPAECAIQTVQLQELISPTIWDKSDGA